MSARRIRLGTSSFSEKSWVGAFYPAGTKPADFLRVYAHHFDTVEVDATYYAIPSARTVDGWARKVPEGFSLAAKFPRSIAHCGEGPVPDVGKVLVPEAVAEPTDVFLGRMDLLGDKCGPLVLQFPWFGRRAPLAKDEFQDRLAAYLDTLPDRFRYGVEVRNRGWVDEPLLAILREHDVALVLVEKSGLPHPADLARDLDLWTTDFAYARLIGDRRAVDRATDTFDRIVLDRDASLVRWAELLRSAPEHVREVRAYANNHYAGHGPATARRLGELLEAGE